MLNNGACQFNLTARNLYVPAQILLPEVFGKLLDSVPEHGSGHPPVVCFRQYNCLYPVASDNSRNSHYFYLFFSTCTLVT